MALNQHRAGEFLSREASIRVRAEKSIERSVDVVASSGAVDSWGTILDQASWDLKRYAANPIVLYAHDRDDCLPIGHATNVRVVDGALLATLNFASAEANPLAEQVWKLIQEGVLRAVSVGFYAQNALPAKVDGQEVYILSGLELLEISVTPIGANPDALVKLSARSLGAAAVVEVLGRARAVPRDPVEVRMDGLKVSEGFAAEVLRTLKAGNEAEALGALGALSALASRCERAEAELAALRASTEASEREALLVSARKDGRLSPATEADVEFSEHLRNAPLAMLRATLRVLPPRPTAVGAAVPTDERSGAPAGVAPAGAPVLSDDEAEFCRMAGITSEQFHAQKSRDARIKGVR